MSNIKEILKRTADDTKHKRMLEIPLQLLVKGTELIKSHEGYIRKDNPYLN
tara:strand:+ start:1601 stop:1753 length:153 start_codon:yes stop_codon:yes gene_type:complete